VRAADIAERQHVSKGYLERILNQLGEAGLVESRKGPGGGFLLTRPAEKISAREVFAASGEELLTAPCMCDPCERDCPLYDDCPARDVWSGLRDAADAYLARRNLAEFVSVGFRAGDNRQNGLRPLWSSDGSSRADGPTVSCPESS
jgi:Rrf2 family iron-sulfur cluster assembly transcriptional regulator